ncbi:MAG: carboxypeptidase-like regulatory domain-containing protein [Terriglobales bacterium]
MLRRHSFALLIAALVVATAAFALAQSAVPGLGRSVHGVVLDARNRPLPGAIVYLTNSRTKVVQTVISDVHATFSFHQLQPNVAYRLYAEWQHQRSAVRTDSAFEVAADLRLDLTIPVE